MHHVACHDCRSLAGQEALDHSSSMSHLDRSALSQDKCGSAHAFSLDLASEQSRLVSYTIRSGGHFACPDLQAPQGNVTAAVSLSNASRAAITPQQLLFSPDNWSQPQQVWAICAQACDHAAVTAVNLSLQYVYSYIHSFIHTLIHSFICSVTERVFLIYPLSMDGHQSSSVCLTDKHVAHWAM